MASLLAAVELVRLQVRIEDHRNGDRNRTQGVGSSSGTAVKGGQKWAEDGQRAESGEQKTRTTDGHQYRRTAYT